MGALWRSYGKHYEISTTGDVYSNHLKRKVKTQTNEDGYEKVSLISEDGKRRTESVHRLVATLFVDNPNNLSFVNHKDGDKQNNRASNLEWVTHNQNIQHAWDTGLLKNTEERSQKLSKAHKGKRKGIDSPVAIQVQCINTGLVYESLTEAAKWLGLSSGNFHNYFKGNQKSFGKHPITKEKLQWKILNQHPN